ncbi:MAG: FxsA family protein [Desulfovibrio sp.]|nr:FxsA family protein [Desulfovibrio sp.]
MSPRLTPQEIAYLLGKSDNDLNTQSVPTVAIQALELLERLMPMRLASYVFLFAVLTIMPMLGFRVMQNLIGLDGSFLVGIFTAFIGVFLIYRNANLFLRQAVEKVRNAETIPVEVLQRGATCAAGILMMLPGPVVNLLALGILCPPVTRLVALSVYRYLQRPKA